MQDGSSSEPADATNDARVRLVTGMLEAVEAAGYAGTTIADVARLARVSKRTFYEHFDSKEQCFLAAYVAASDEMLKAIEMAAETATDWNARVDACVLTYLSLLEANRNLTRVFLLEIHSAGPAAVSARRGVHQRFADQLRGLVAKARKTLPELKPLSPKLAQGLVGGINELVLVALEQDGERLGALAGAASELVRAVVMRA